MRRCAAHVSKFLHLDFAEDVAIRTKYECEGYARNN